MKLKPNQIWNKYICPAIEVTVQVAVGLGVFAAMIALAYIVSWSV